MRHLRLVLGSTLLLLAQLSFAGTATLFDSFATAQNAIDAESVANFPAATETLSGNRQFAVDDGASGSISGGQLSCTLNGAGACILGYNFVTPEDLSGFSGLVLTDAMTQGSVAVGITISDVNGTVGLAESSVLDGETVIEFSSLLAPFGTLDLTRVSGVLIGFLGDSDAASIELGQIDLAGGAGGGGGGGGGAAVTLTPASTTTVYDVARDGEGVQIAILPGGDGVIVTWYTYQQGEQLWLIGNGDLVDGRATFELIQASGAQFGPDFRSEDVVRTVWGSGELEILDCNSVRLTATPAGGGFEPITISMGRLLPADCALIEANQASGEALLGFDQSGTYFDRARDGEGFQLTVEADGRTVIVTWYTYLNGNPVWLIGAGAVENGRLEVEMTITSGAEFGFAFDPTAVQRTAWGSLTIIFQDCNRFEARATPILAGFDPITLFVEKIVPAVCE